MPLARSHEVLRVIPLLRRLAPLAPRLSATLVLSVGVAVLGACATAAITTPRSRVAKDLGCTTEQTGVRQLSAIPGEKAARWEVTGCGHTAVYVCTTPVRDCWREGELQQATDAR